MGQKLKFWRWPLANQILSGLVFGILLGLAAGHWVDSAAGQARLDLWVTQLIQPLGRLFIRIIFMIVVPLIFSAIVLGVAEMGDVRKLGRVGLRSLWFTLLLSGTSVFVGITFVDVLKPGQHLGEETRHELLARYGADAEAHTVHLSSPDAPPLADTLLNLIPQNPLAEAVNAFAPNYTGGGLMSVMVFSLFFGVALALVPREKSAGLISVLQGTFEVCMRVIHFAMRLAPMGVTCLGFVMAETLGIEMVKSLGFYMGVVIAGLAFQQFVVYSLFLKFVGGYSPRLFFSRIKEVMLTAFSTSSSNATLPVSLRVGEENLKLPSRISRFVLTVGASANQNGTALYEGVTVLFLAQVFGVELTLAQQIVVTFMCIMTGLGTAGVPGGSLPLVVGVLVTLGIPGESIAIILGIDRLLDMCRSCLNVTGDLVCAVLVSRNEAPDEVPLAEAELAS
ncbi:sodium:dicarboxylate symporter [Cephaloticoccus primus]|uniref:Sodium:dicarboxylate symporter n=1 Tax=Cephaloticoccus primus TaxID=1548207 RepID=A0A139SN09_9BACT|nr:dicarboxylate/amino acid:cation symporter [Cephaloticoccus primus]KXU35948.1 sodium:dicarboxylate symporter [Cephaloticoccus primus]